MKISLFLSIVSMAAASGPFERLRYLFDSVEEFAVDANAETALPSEVQEALVSSTLRFANEADRELDCFVDVLRFISVNGVTKQHVHDLKWTAVSRLFEAPRARPAAVAAPVVELKHIEPPLVVPREPIEPAPFADLEDVEPVHVESRIEAAESKTSEGKTGDMVSDVVDEDRGFEEGEVEEDAASRAVTSVLKKRKEREDEGESIRPSLQEYSARYRFIEKIHRYRHTKNWENERRTDGTRYLNFVHFRLAEQGKYEELLEKLLALQKVHTFYLPILFEDAYLFLTRDRYEFGETRRREMEELVKRTEAKLSLSGTKASLLKHLDKYFADRDFDTGPLSDNFVQLEAALLTKYRDGRFDELQRELDHYELAMVARGKIQSLFRRVYNYLKRP